MTLVFEARIQDSDSVNSLVNVPLLSKTMLLFLTNVTYEDALTNSAYCALHFWVVKHIILLYFGTYNPLRGGMTSTVNLKQSIAFICMNCFVVLNSVFVAFLKMDYMVWCFNPLFLLTVFPLSHQSLSDK